jgi:hypothetical protein
MAIEILQGAGAVMLVVLWLGTARRVSQDQRLHPQARQGMSCAVLLMPLLAIVYWATATGDRPPFWLEPLPAEEVPHAETLGGSRTLPGAGAEMSGSASDSVLRAKDRRTRVPMAYRKPGRHGGRRAAGRGHRINQGSAPGQRRLVPGCGVAPHGR